MLQGETLQGELLQGELSWGETLYIPKFDFTEKFLFEYDLLDEMREIVTR